MKTIAAELQDFLGSSFKVEDSRNPFGSIKIVRLTDKKTFNIGPEIDYEGKTPCFFTNKEI